MARNKREIMKKQKLYFKDVDSTICHPLSYHLTDAIADEETEITLVEAFKDKTEKDYIFCREVGEAGERSSCNKRECELWSPNKSGRGVCASRGSLYWFGDEVTFNVETGLIISTPNKVIKP